MPTRIEIPLTPDVQLADAHNIPVWQHVAWNRLTREFPESAGWVCSKKEYADEHSYSVWMFADRGLFRGFRQRMILAYAQPDHLTYFAFKHSTLADRLLAGFGGGGLALGFLGGLIARITGGPGTILIQHIPFLALALGAVGLILAFPFVWMLRQMAMSRAQVNAVAASMTSRFGADEEVTPVLKAVEAELADVEFELREQAAASDRALRDGIEPEDRALSADELQRKYGYAKGRRIYELVRDEPA